MPITGCFSGIFTYLPKIFGSNDTIYNWKKIDIKTRLGWAFFCDSHFSWKSINRFPLRLGIVETTDCLFKHWYDEEIFCWCDSYHFVIIKTNKNLDLHCWCQLVRIYTVGVNRLGCTPLLSIGQDLHRGRVIY